MRLPFFRRRKPGEPVRIPIPEMLPSVWGVYFTPQGSPPDPASLEPQVAEWVDRNCPPPLRDLVQAARPNLVGTEVRPRGEFPEPPEEYLQLFRPGEWEERDFRAATHVLTVWSSDLPRPPHAGFWAGLVTALALSDAVRGVVFDPLTLSLRRAAGYDLPEGDFKLPLRQFLIVPHSVSDRGQGWVTTKGLSRFGLPELEIRDVPPNLLTDFGMLANVLADRLLARLDDLAEQTGEAPRELRLPSEMRLTLAEISQVFGEPDEPPVEGAKGWTLLGWDYIPGGRKRDDFLRLLPPPGARVAHGVWLNSVRTDLFGAQDTLRNVPSDSEAMEVAHLRAVAELPTARTTFQEGLEPGDQLLVKHGFPAGGDNHEYMWIVVNTWQGDRIRGQLANDPQIRLDLRPGQSVEIRESEVYDWILLREDGTQLGGYTNAVVESEHE